MKAKSPMLKALIGNQGNLNAGLRSAIEAAPTKMKKESMAPMKKESMAKMKKESSMRMMDKKSPAKKKTTFAEAYKNRDMKTYGNLTQAEYTKEAKRQITNKKKTTKVTRKEYKKKDGSSLGVSTKTTPGSYDAPKSQMKGSVTGPKTESGKENTKLPVGDKTLTKTKNEVKKQKRLARNEKQKAMAKNLKYRLLGKAGRAKMEAKGYVPKSKKK